MYSTCMYGVYRVHSVNRIYTAYIECIVLKINPQKSETDIKANSCSANFLNIIIL